MSRGQHPVRERHPKIGPMDLGNIYVVLFLNFIVDIKFNVQQLNLQLTTNESLLYLTFFNFNILLCPHSFQSPLETKTVDHTFHRPSNHIPKIPRWESHDNIFTAIDNAAFKSHAYGFVCCGWHHTPSFALLYISYIRKKKAKWHQSIFSFNFRSCSLESLAFSDWENVTITIYIVVLIFDRCHCGQLK